MALDWIPQFLILLLAIIIILKYSTRGYDYWKKRGIYYPQPVPFLGNLADIVFMRRSILDWTSSLYFSTNEPFLGIFTFDEPCLVLRCPKLIQHVLVKDFHHFTDRSMAVPLHDESAQNSLFFQKYDKWRTSRTTLNRVFTSGKLKRMFCLIDQIGRELVQYLDHNLGVIEIKEVCAKYTTNVIAKCAYGIEANCFRDEEASFRKYGRKMFNSSCRNTIATIMYMFKRRWVEIFQLDFFSREVTSFFHEAFLQTVRQRETSKTRVHDFVDLLIDLKSDEGYEAVCGQAIMFFAAGFETMSITISFTLHELCLNRDIQDKLRKEILETTKKYGGFTYEAIKEMKYLEMCISETLRKYPVLPFLHRTCNADYLVPGTDLVIEKGNPVYIPTAGLNMDEKYFPEPQKYNPDRFIGKNYNDNGIVYMPFGEGPRYCIAKRFGLLSVQLALAHVLSKFEFERSAGTPDPVKFSQGSIMVQSEAGTPMEVKICDTNLPEDS